MARQRKRKTEKEKHQPELTATSKKEVWAKRLAILIIFSMVFGVYAIVSINERQKRRQDKLSYVRNMYETMAMAQGYTLDYTIDSRYIVGTSFVEIHYLAHEEVDQANQRKKLTLRTYGTYMGTDIDTLQIYYYHDGKCLQENRYIDESGEEKSTFSETTEAMDYSYNPMLALAVMVTDHPGEYKKKGNSLNGSVSLEDINTLLSLCPFNNLFQGIEGLSCYGKQVNSLTISSDGERFKSALIDLDSVAFYMLQQVYEERSLSLDVDTYRITIIVDSWETPVIEIPEVNLKEGEVTK